MFERWGFYPMRSFEKEASTQPAVEAPPAPAAHDSVSAAPAAASS
jgi:biotin synthase